MRAAKQLPGRGVFCLFQALTARYLNVTDCGGVGRGGDVKGIESRDGYFWKGHKVKPVFFVCALMVFKILYSLYCCGISLSTFYLPL